MKIEEKNNKHITLLLPGGLLSPGLMRKITEIAGRYNLTFYCTTAQNIRLLGVCEENIDEIKRLLTGLGIQLKAPGKFPVPKVCVGKPFCNLGVADTFSLAEMISEKYGDRTDVKPKFKIAVAGCPASCSGALLADIGIVATRKGFDLYAGGKGGPLPRVGERVARGLTVEEIIEAVGRMADYHAANTSKKQRMFKLLDNSDFPFPAKNQ